MTKGNRLVIGFVLMFCKLFRPWINVPESRGKAILLRHITGDSHLPIISFSNHQSTTDDPFMWVWLPLAPLLVHPERARWSLGAGELLFRSAVSRWFFSAGQVIPVSRAPGSSPTVAVKTAMQLLTENRWIHLFSEGHIYQNHNDAPVLPLKPGVAFLIARHYDSTGQPPIVIPMLLRGFQRFLPKHKIIPRFFSVRTQLIISPSENSGITAAFLRSLNKFNQGERIVKISLELDRSLARIYARAMCDAY